jgi:hypothetical protein
MVYPRNNFATDAKYWGREVEKKITNLESSLQSSDINNTTRDSQLSVTSNQALIAANDAKAAATAAQDAADDALVAFNAAGAANTAAINAANEASAANSEALDALQKIIQLGSPGGPTINASNLSAGTITGVTIQGNVITGGSISGTAIDAVSFTTGGIVDAADVNCGELYASQNINSGNYLGTSFSSVANNTTGSFAGNVFINTSGNMFRSTQTSSRDAKENISPIEFDTDAFISVNPVEFNYKTEAVSTAEEAALPQLGFILEDFEDAGVYDHLIIPTNELDNYKGLRYDKLYMYLHKVVQTQNETIKTLKARLDALEAE